MASALSPLLGPEFDNFLFAPVGEERNGMLLSVVSALARLDVDPWQEAAKLARLPGKSATERLTSLIAALPEDSSRRADPGTIAAGLIALLPRQAAVSLPLHAPLPGIASVTNSRAFIYVASLIFVMSVLFFVASHQTPAETAHGLAAGTVMPQTVPPNSD